MRSRRISTQRRLIIGSSSIPARCTRSRTPKPPSSARSSTCRSDTTPKWIRKRRPRRPSSLPLTFKNKQKRPPTWWPFLSVAESSQHDQIRTGNRRGLHGCPDLKLLDFGRRCSAFSREISWAAASLLDTFAADEIGERESGFGRYCCKSRFAEGVKNSEGRRRGFRVEI